MNEALPNAAGHASGVGLPAEQKVLEVQARLCRHYECPIRRFQNHDPLSALVSALLSHRTLNRDSGKAFRALKERFGEWATVRDAPVAEVEDAIRECTWPEQKAPRIQAVLREVTARGNGELSLDFLTEWPVEQSRTWLQTIPGVGPKTSAAVMSFSTLQARALPVDSHHHRVAVRLGLIPENMAVGPSHKVLEAQLPQDWSEQQVFDNHQVIMRHGKDTCTWKAPRCERCILLDLCPTGQQRLDAGKA